MNLPSPLIRRLAHPPQDTLLALFERRINLSGSRAALRSYAGNNRWHSSSWSMWWQRAECLAAGLVSLGVKPGDSVALLSQTREEWAILDVAIMMAGGVVVPLYPASLGEGVITIIKDAGARYVFAENPEQAQKVLSLFDEDEFKIQRLMLIDESSSSQGNDKSQVLHIEDLDPDSLLRKQEHLLLLNDLTARGRRLLADDAEVVARRRDQCTPDTLATLVYTSGTTGEPLGVCITHAQMLAEVRALTQMSLLDSSDVHLMALPLAHIFARVVLWVGVCVGFETVFSRGLSYLLRDMQQVSPTIFAGVPHLFERMKRHLMARLQRFESPYLRKGVDLLMTQAVEISRQRQFSTSKIPGGMSLVAHRIFERVLYPQIKSLFGGKLRFFISGGAPLPVHIAEFFHGCDVLILEGYGLTETCAAITLNTPEDFRFGSVGRPLPGVDITIAPNGEILVRSQMCTSRYFENEKRTAMLIDEQGWLHTGDLGKFDQDGYLYINGRLKNLIVTSGGKNIAPLGTEKALEGSPFIAHAVLFGDGRPYLTALITLDIEVVLAWAKTHESLSKELAARQKRVSVMDESVASWLTQHPEVRALVAAQVEVVNSELAGYESIRKFDVLDADFSLVSGELTPTLKLKRATVEARYRQVLRRLYGDQARVDV